MPHLVAWYIEKAGKAMCPPMLDSWSRRPPPWSRRCGTTARASWMDAVRLVAIIVSTCWSLRFPGGAEDAEARVGDHHVDPSQVGEGRRDDPAQLGGVGDV